jgi:hypothetical protein
MKFWLRSVLFIGVVHNALAWAQPSVKAQVGAAPQSTQLRAIQPMDNCLADPKFIAKFGISRKAMIDTTQAEPIGASVVEFDEKGRVLRRGQHPSWASAGYLGRIQRDSRGNIFVYPAPGFTVAHNPPEKANILYKIDTETGVMEPFANIDSGERPNERNPFGLLALALDCTQNALYAATVMGSTIDAERGALVRIGLADKKVTVVKKGIDALSLSVVSEERGARLLVGLARDNAIVSYAIKPDGTLGDDAVTEINLDEHPVAQDKRPRILRVTREGTLFVRAVPFEYTLAVRSVIPTAEITFDVTRIASKRIYKAIKQESKDIPVFIPGNAPPAAATPTPGNSAPAKTP